MKFIYSSDYRSRGNSYLIMAIVVLAGTGYLSSHWWLKINGMALAAKESARIEVALSPTLEAVTAAYQNEKAAADQEAANKELALAAIFPTNSEETTLTRMFDTYVSKHDYANSPLFLESLTLGTPEIDEKNGAAYLPVDLSMQGSRDNFFGFLSYIENSGALDEQVRLMDVAEVSVQVEENDTAAEDTGAVPMVSFSVNIRAYFQQPLGTASNEQP